MMNCPETLLVFLDVVVKGAQQAFCVLGRDDYPRHDLWPGQTRHMNREIEDYLSRRVSNHDNVRVTSFDVLAETDFHRVLPAVGVCRSYHSDE